MCPRSFRPICLILAGLTLIVASALSSVSTSKAGEEMAPQAPWFQPTLTTNSDSICDAFLSGARTHDATYRNLNKVPPFFSDEDRTNSSVQSVPDRPELLSLTRHARNSLYVEHITIPGCGGGCETESLGLYASLPSSEQQDGATLPRAEGWSIYETGAGDQYVAGIVDYQLEVYRPTVDAQWQLACRVQLEPDLDHSKDPHVQQALSSIHALRDAAEDIARGEGAGMCGTMHTPDRWRVDFEHALGQVLFDPQATAVHDNGPASANSYGDYGRIYPALEQWSLGGLSEYRALQRYDAQLRDTYTSVSAFYQYGFHWTAPRSVDVAQESIHGAVSRLFGFYMYNPYPASGEEELRRALLTRQPMSTIRSIAIDLEALNQSSGDSILNVAIEYPEALTYLLSQGADPNHANVFGKTPLMYAAQDDHLQAVEILLRAGADPNATTTVPPDNCEFNISTTQVSPLHYAARYASGALIQALLDAGAATSIESEGQQAGYPVDWLHRYHGPATIGPGLPAIQARLQIPDDQQRHIAAERMVARAEAANAAGDSLGAYRDIRSALASDNRDVRAIGDLPVLALKVGQVGLALEAATKALSAAKTPSEQAAAWFNTGLACEKSNRPMTLYNGKAYCTGDRVELFLRAWQLEPRPARGAELIHLLQTPTPADCVVPLSDGSDERYRFVAVFDFTRTDQVQRVYVLHSPAATINPAEVQWHIVRSTELGIPHLVKSYPIDKDHAITVLEGNTLAASATVKGHQCSISGTAVHVMH